MRLRNGFAAGSYCGRPTGAGVWSGVSGEAHHGGTWLTTCWCIETWVPSLSSPRFQCVCRAGPWDASSMPLSGPGDHLGSKTTETQSPAILQESQGLPHLHCPFLWTAAHWGPRRALSPCPSSDCFHSRSRGVRTGKAFISWMFSIQRVSLTLPFYPYSPWPGPPHLLTFFPLPKHTVLVPKGYHGKVPQTEWLKVTHW